MKFNVDFSQASSGLVPEGSYIVAVSDATEGVSKSGNKKLTIKYEIQEGKYAGKSLWDSLSLSKNSLWRLQKFIRALNLPSGGKQKVDTDEWLGKRLIVLVRKSTYQDRETNKVMDFKALDETGEPKDSTAKILETPKEKKYESKEEVNEDLKDIIG